MHVRFTDGAVLSVSASPDGLAVNVAIEPTGPEDSSRKPTERQGECLAFIARYIQRFGRAPAESDIQRHFLISAPTVNQMMQVLERRGCPTLHPPIH
jgi:hypothetical protein